MRPLRISNRGSNLWFLLGGILFVIAAIIGSHAEGNAPWAFVVMIGACALSCVAYALFGVKCYFEFGDEILVRYFFRHRVIRWSDVTFVNFRHTNVTYLAFPAVVIPTAYHTLTLRLTNGQALTINIDPTLIGEIAAAIEQRATLDMHREQERREAEAVSIKKFDRRFNIAAGLVILIGGISFAADLGQEINEGYSSFRWPSATASITKSSLTSDAPTDVAPREKTHYYPVVEYRYNIDGKEYTGNRLRFLPEALTSPSEAQNVQNHFSASKTILVRYKPSDPSVSVLIPGIRDSDAERGYVVLGIFILAAFGGLLLALTNVLLTFRQSGRPPHRSAG